MAECSTSDTPDQVTWHRVSSLIRWSISVRVHPNTDSGCPDLLGIEDKINAKPPDSEGLFHGVFPDSSAEASLKV